jgi:hypothetical protein
LANVVCKSRIPGKTEFILDCDLPMECPAIEPFQFEMIDRVNLVTEIFQGTEKGFRHVLVEKDFH